MREITDKEIIKNIDKIYYDLINDKNDYVIEGNFDYLKKNDLLCIPIFRGDDYINDLSEILPKFVKKRNEDKCFVVNKFWDEDKSRQDTKIFENEDVSESFFDTIIDDLNLTIFGFFFFKINLYIVFNTFDYFLLIGKKTDIEELTNLTMLELLEYTKEIDWYSDDSPEMYKTYKKFFEETKLIEKNK